MFKSNGWKTLAAFSLSAAALCPGASADGPATWVGPANNAFGSALYTRLAATDQGNFFFSPCSIETALAMTYAGARGDTARQMATVLNFPEDPKATAQDLGAFIKELNGGDKARGYNLDVANALWGQKGYAFLPDFLTLLKSNYSAGLKEIDFKRDTTGARKTINNWVESATHDKIVDLIAPDILTPDTRLVLTNAIYFKGNWKDKFDKAATKDEAFYPAPGQSHNVPTMHLHKREEYSEADNCQVLKLSYGTGDLSMVILLPKAADGLPLLEKGLAPLLTTLRDKFREEAVDISLPRFKITKSFELAPVLRDLGMPDAFGESADFSGMVGKRDLAISNVIHKAFVGVNEDGTEAAAATAVVMTRATAIMEPPHPPVVFRADHPFIFLIEHESSGAILFMGRVSAP